MSEANQFHLLPCNFMSAVQLLIINWKCCSPAQSLISLQFSSPVAQMPSSTAIFMIHHATLLADVISASENS
jgi:hypothetical protein